jgi:hypothetical protein
LPRLLGQRDSFTPEEVRQRLQLDVTANPRTAAVHGAAARSGIWSGLLPDNAAFELGRAANRLPTIVFWYSQGMPPGEIGRRLSPFGSAWDADRALSVATALIATVLNSHGLSEFLA